jgi:hypothetical protein
MHPMKHWEFQPTNFQEVPNASSEAKQRTNHLVVNVYTCFFQHTKLLNTQRMRKITNLGGARKISREFLDLKEEEPNV